MINEPAINMAYKQVLTYIRQNEIGIGGKLPAQSQMVEELGVGSNVLQSAMKKLEAQGVIKRKPRVGTVVNENKTTQPIDWQVGIFIPSIHGQHTPYYAVFLELVLTRLIQYGCCYQIYNFDQFPQSHRELKKVNKQMASDLTNNILDALVVPSLSEQWLVNYCEKIKLPLATVADHRLVKTKHNNFLIGSDIQQDEMIQQAVTLLATHPCKNICLISDDGPSHMLGGQWEAFVNCIASHSIQGMEMHMGHGLILAGRKIGQALLKMPHHARPDGLIITNDDHICLGLTDVLNQQSDYRPQITVYGCQQAPLAFALPVYRFEYNIDEMVQATVNKLLARLQGRYFSPPPKPFIPKLNPAGPSALPPQWNKLIPNPPCSGLVQHDQPKVTLINATATS